MISTHIIALVLVIIIIQTSVPTPAVHSQQYRPSLSRRGLDRIDRDGSISALSKREVEKKRAREIDADPEVIRRDDKTSPSVASQPPVDTKEEPIVPISKSELAENKEAIAKGASTSTGVESDDAANHKRNVNGDKEVLLGVFKRAQLNGDTNKTSTGETLGGSKLAIHAENKGGELDSVKAIQGEKMGSS